MVVIQFLGSTTPCTLYANGNMTTQTASPWTIGATEQMILVVNGNLTINSPITITSGGFFAAVVNGNITVSPAVGTTASSTTTSLDGIYVASNATKSALFSTGDSSVVGSERLNIAGSVIADEFLLQRNTNRRPHRSPRPVRSSRAAL